MKVILKLLYGLLLINLITKHIYAQELSIGNETTLSLGQSIFYFPGNWKNSGTLKADFGTVIFNGGNGNQTIESTNEEIFSFIIVNKMSGDLQLLNDITINGDLDIINGDLDGNNNTVTLDGGLNGRAGGPIIETPGNTFKGGIITTLVPFLNAPDSFSTMGLTITSEKDLGSTLLERGHEILTDGDTTSILRFYNIAPSNNSDLNATLVFSYDESELNGLAEKDLSLFLIPDSGPGWIKIEGIVDTQANTVTASGIAQFNLMTLAANTNLVPVELISFTASLENKLVKLKWQTATELNNKGFEIERKNRDSEYKNQDNKGWTRIGFVEGSGSTTEFQFYSFTDKNPTGGSNFIYRIKQIDFDGSYKYSDEIEVNIIPEKFLLSQNYPNPFNPSTTIKYSLKEESRVQIKVYNSIGQEVAALVNEIKPAGYYSIIFNAKGLPSGIYFYKISAGSFSQVKKMLLIK
ncbi:MAG: T9SS type A sorting domain-containing protein [Ignavibacteriaceae bacterium]